MVEATERYFQIQHSDTFHHVVDALRVNPNPVPVEWKSYRFPDSIRIEFEPDSSGDWEVWILNGSGSWLHHFVLDPKLTPSQETAIALHREYIIEPVQAKLAQQAARRRAMEEQKEFKVGDKVKGTMTASPTFILEFIGTIKSVQVYESGLSYDITLTDATGTHHEPGDVIRYAPTDEMFQVQAYKTPSKYRFMVGAHTDGNFLILDLEAREPVSFPEVGDRAEHLLFVEDEGVAHRLAHFASHWGRVRFYHQTAKFTRLKDRAIEEEFTVTFLSPMRLEEVADDDSEMIAFIEGLATEALFLESDWAGDQEGYSTPFLESIKYT